VKRFWQARQIGVALAVVTVTGIFFKTGYEKSVFVREKRI
jgi:hypothetical protein